MSIRPRYSLLTLFIVTALVAGGVMYFRIPHRAVVSDPPTAEEQLHLDENFISTDFFTHYDKSIGSLELEYEYQRTWQGQHWRSMVARPRSNFFLVGVNDSRHEASDRWAFFPESMFEEQKEQYEKLAPGTRIERVRALVLACENPREKLPVSTGTTITQGTTVQLPTFAFRTVGGCPGESCYLLTDQRHIFQMISSYIVFLGIPVTLEEIPDEAVRRRIVEELAAIPDPQ